MSFTTPVRTVDSHGAFWSVYVTLSDGRTIGCAFSSREKARKQVAAWKAGLDLDMFASV